MKAVLEMHRVEKDSLNRQHEEERAEWRERERLLESRISEERQRAAAVLNDSVELETQRIRTEFAKLYQDAQKHMQLRLTDGLFSESVLTRLQNENKQLRDAVAASKDRHSSILSNLESELLAHDSLVRQAVEDTRHQSIGIKAAALERIHELEMQLMDKEHELSLRR